MNIIILILGLNDESEVSVSEGDKGSSRKKKKLSIGNALKDPSVKANYKSPMKSDADVNLGESEYGGERLRKARSPNEVITVEQNEENTERGFPSPGRTSEGDIKMTDKSVTQSIDKYKIHFGDPSNDREDHRSSKFRQMESKFKHNDSTENMIGRRGSSNLMEVPNHKLGKTLPPNIKYASPPKILQPREVKCKVFGLH
jgi:hypothetical protein